MSKVEPLHILDALTEYQGFDTAIYCTYGADLAFFEEAVLRPLRATGCRQHIIFMDGERYADTIRHWSGSTELVGQHYLLVPVQMPPFQVFHPKLIMLLGVDRGRLLIGSGNLTFTGLGQNHELFTCLDWTADKPDTGALFQAVWEFIMTIQKRWGHSALVDEALRKAQYRAYWLTQMSDSQPDEIIFWHSLDVPLLDQLAQKLAGEQVKQITIISPFLDKEVKAITELHARFRPTVIRLILQDNQAVGDPEKLALLQRQGVPLTIHTFDDDNRYLHGKLLLLESEAAVYALSGSANCTRPALLGTPGNRRNVETVLLYRSETLDYFAYLFPDDLLLHQSVAPTQLNLLTRRLSDTDFDLDDVETTTVAPLRLLDVIMKGETIQIKLTLNRPLSPEVTTLHVKAETMPPVYLPLTNMEISSLIEMTMSVPQSWFVLSGQSLSATVVGMDNDGRYLDLGINSIWVTQADVLAQAAREGRYIGGRASNFLMDMLAESEDDWRDLYAELQRLVQLGVAAISHKTIATTTSTDTSVKTNLPTVEKETNITLATTADPLGLDEVEQLENDVFRESELQAFWDHVRQSLPGHQSLTSGKSVRTIITPPPVRPRRPPNSNQKRQFLNLVKKYIASLHNVEYMQQAAVGHILIYYVTFQRVLYLLYKHHGLEDTDYLDLMWGINNGFFGSDSATPPVADPCRQRHIRHIYGDQWLDTEVPFYALASIWQAKQWLAQVNDPERSVQWQSLTQQMLACLRLVIQLPVLYQTIESLTPLSDLSHVYETAVEDLALSFHSLLTFEGQEQADILRRWCGHAAFDPNEIPAGRLASRWYQANVDYRRALYGLYVQYQETTQLKPLVQELTFWLRRADRPDEAQIWGRRLVDLYRQEGDDGETAVALYHHAQQLLFAKEYALAEQFAREALTLADKLDNHRQSQRFQKLLEHIAYLWR